MSSDAQGCVRVEVVYALPDKQSLVALVLDDGSTVRDAVEASGLLRQFPGLAVDGDKLGVWGRPVTMDYELADGDRVELYRPLAMDPREARRQLALLGKSMGGGPG